MTQSTSFDDEPDLSSIFFAVLFNFFFSFSSSDIELLGLELRDLFCFPFCWVIPVTYLMSRVS